MFRIDRSGIVEYQMRTCVTDEDLQVPGFYDLAGRMIAIGRMEQRWKVVNGEAWGRVEEGCRRRWQVVTTEYIYIYIYNT